MSMRTWALGLLVLSTTVGVQAAEEGSRRPLAVEDLAALREIAHPRISPEGEWVAFEVEHVKGVPPAAE